MIRMVECAAAGRTDPSDATAWPVHGGSNGSFLGDGCMRGDDARQATSDLTGNQLDHLTN